MENLVFVEPTAWNADSAHWIAQDKELICSQGGAISRYGYDEIEKIRLSSQVDWRFRASHRCRVFLAGRQPVVFKSEPTGESIDKLGRFAGGLAKRAWSLNPAVSLHWGYDPVKWLIILAFNLALAAFFIALLIRAPRTLVPSIVVGLVFTIYLLDTLQLLFSNRPKEFDLGQSQASTPIASGIAGEGLRHFLAERYEKLVLPFIEIGTFLFSPTAHAPGVKAHERKSFRTAMSGLTLVLPLFLVAIETMAWILTDKVEITLAMRAAIYTLVGGIPALWLLTSFLILRTIFHYEGIALSRYLHASAYAASAFVMLEIILTSGGFILSHINDSAYHYLNPSSCGPSSKVDCLSINAGIYAAKRQLLGHLLIGLILGALVGWAAIAVQFSRLCKASFNINALHAHSVNFSVPVLLLALPIIYIFGT